MIYLGYVLATLWAVGLFAVCVYFTQDICNTNIGKFFTACLLLPIWVIMGLAPFAFIHHQTGDVEATLLKSEWQCSGGHNETSTSFVQSGKVMVPITSTHFVCDQYNRK